METKKEKQASILIIVFAIILIGVIIFEMLVNKDKFMDHLLSASLALVLIGTGIIQLKKINNKKEQ